jgi:DNA-binding transcriptional regulator YdaS (Cro superfamily)
MTITKKGQQEAIRRAIDLLGGQRAAADRTGYSRHAMYKAYNGLNVRGQSTDVVIALASATSGKVKLEEMLNVTFGKKRPRHGA